mmetsp:Transcript_14362/g.18127  ORF Transcript_14362/g.18127 Transcript_14362/m.18127 type:complete len:169 (-) Transcript_14362:87-593(-)
MNRTISTPSILTPKKQSHPRRHSTQEAILLRRRLQNVMHVSHTNRPRESTRVNAIDATNEQSLHSGQNEIFGYVYNDASCHDVCNVNNYDNKCIYSNPERQSLSLCDKQSKLKQKRKGEVRSVFETDGRFTESDGFYIYDNAAKSDTKGLCKLNIRRRLKQSFNKTKK